MHGRKQGNFKEYLQSTICSAPKCIVSAPVAPLAHQNEYIEAPSAFLEALNASVQALTITLSL